MKIALVNPSPMDLEQDDPRPKFSSFAEPLGLLYIAEMLKSNGYEVCILDHGTTNFTFSQVIEWINNEAPDVLGISVLTRSFLSGITIARLAKKSDPNLTVILGNYHTVCAEKILQKYSFIDICVCGEGEFTMLELLPLIKNGKSDFHEVDGIYYRENDIIKSTPPRKLEDNLDVFPIPDRTLIEEGNYKMSIGGLDISEDKSATIIMSRGCPFKCRFCTVHQRKWRYRSIENIMEELRLLESEGYREIMVMDDNFTLNPQWVIDICKAIIREGIDLVFHCEGRIEGTRQMYEYMNRANFKSIFFGMESGTQAILDYYNKKITPDKCKLALKKARGGGLDILMASFIVGSPPETLEEIRNTIQFAFNIDIDYAMFHIFEVFPGIEIWDELIDQGRLDPDKYWETGVRVAELPFYKYNVEFLTNIIKRTYKKFYSLARPKFIFKQAIRSFKSDYRRDKLGNLAKDVRSSLQMLDSLSEKRF